MWSLIYSDLHTGTRDVNRDGFFTFRYEEILVSKTPPAINIYHILITVGNILIDNLLIYIVRTEL